MNRNVSFELSRIMNRA